MFVVCFHYFLNNAQNTTLSTSSKNKVKALREAYHKIVCCKRIALLYQHIRLGSKTGIFLSPESFPVLNFCK